MNVNKEANVTLKKIYISVRLLLRHSILLFGYT